MQKFMLMKLKVGHHPKPWYLIIPGKDSRRFKNWGDAWMSITAQIYGDGTPAVTDASLFDAESRERSRLNKLAWESGRITEATYWANNVGEYRRREAYFKSIGIWHKQPAGHTHTIELHP